MAGVLSRVAGAVRKAFTPANQQWSPSWLAAAGRNPWTAGKTPTPESLTAVHACVRLLTGGLLGAQLKLIQERRDGGRERIVNGDAAALLTLLGDDLRRTFEDMLLTGNGYAQLVRNGRGGPERLRWLSASRCTLVRETGSTELHLKVMPQWSDAEPELVLAQGEFLHLKLTPSSSEIYGQSPLDRLAPGMSAAVSIIDGASKLLGQAIAPGAVMSIPAGLKPEARERLREQMQRQFAGEGKGKTVVLDFESKIERLQTPEQMLSQAFVELARFSVSEVARAYSVPLSLLAETTDTNRATAEQESRHFAMFSVQPLARQVAQELTRLLVSREDRLAGMRIELDLTDQLLGHGVERAEYASKLINGGVASANELRDLLGLPDVAGGDELARPVNTAPQSIWVLGQGGSQPAEQRAFSVNVTGTGTPETGQQRLSEADEYVQRAEARLRLITGGKAAENHISNLVRQGQADDERQKIKAAQ